MRRRRATLRLRRPETEAPEARGCALARGGLHVAVVDAQGRPLRAHGLDRWLASLARRRARGFVTVALVSNARIRALNRTFRQVDRVTDVLSFPAGTPRRRRPRDPDGDEQLGDIVIATEIARRQAQQYGHSWATEVRILALHGLLHLIGYDHQAPSDDGAMARIERTWRRRGGLPEGLIDRALARERAKTGGGTRLTTRGSGARPIRRASGRAKTGGGTPD